MLDLDEFGLLEQAAADVGLSTEYAALLARARRADELEQAQRWIPVSERLPEVGDTIICTYSGSEYYYIGETGGVAGDLDEMTVGDIHDLNTFDYWMPRPVPPS